MMRLQDHEVPKNHNQTVIDLRNVTVGNVAMLARGERQHSR